MPEYYGWPAREGAAVNDGSSEARDDGRIGHVRIVRLSDFATTDPIQLHARDSGFAPDAASAAAP